MPAARHHEIFRKLLGTLLVYEPVLDGGGELVDVVVRDASDEAAARLGRPPGELVGRRASGLFGPGFVEEWMPRLRQVAATGDAARWETRGTDGRHDLAGVFRLDDGSLVAVAIDITERKQGEESLRAQAEALRRRAEEVEALMSTAPVALWVAQDAACHEIVGNPTANAFYEAREGENVSAHPRPGEPVPTRRFWDRDGRPLAAEELPMQVAAARNVEVRDAELEVELESGTRRTILGNASPLRNADGTVRGCVAAFLDVTERRRAELAVREADRRKDEFLAVLSHELRNPLAPILNGVAVLERADPASEAARRARATIAHQAAHLSRLVDDLLDVNRVAHGKVRLQLEDIEVGDVLRRTVDDHRDLLARAGVLLECRAVREPLVVRGDRTRLAQVLGNLLQNAAKFTPAGGRVTVAVDATEGEVAVRVRDTGLGIAPAELARVFEPFAQAARTADRSRGLGLGLALVKGLVELHGGRVAARSAGPGEGAEFTLTLPRAPARAAAARPAPVQPGATHPRVLVIDDSEDAAMSLRDILELAGFDAHVALDGARGVEAASALRPHAVICDVDLPDVDGYEVARRLRAAGSTAVLIALTGYAAERDVARARAAGFDHHLAKPADLERLAALLR